MLRSSLSKEATVISLGGLSKNWVVPGFRIGWGILCGDAERLELREVAEEPPDRLLVLLANRGDA